ncbi:putative O-linked N-acetylglucosamine transferase (SPINDLY family) [Neisseria perflava]|uniref:O-linked N-acetylglucosamine transferase, SPINDLY family protein n=1 Tax=Neisseria perflava TaxID=33053 RepID=UPI0020A1C1AF|nr:tetratricopeptide repeat protein [Neisseria perflava]MCP1772797.1 putative O-linked N-acetylglucosamine transferase (SPINDLY family) [Neisseria perflava]
MSKKPRLPKQKKATLVNPLMGKFLQQGGVKVKAEQTAEEKAAKAAQNEIVTIEKERGAGEAVNYAREALKKYPNHSGILNNLGVMLMRSRRYAEAVEAFKQIPNYAKDAQALSNIGVSLLRQNDYGKASEYLSASLKVDPSYEPALLAMGQVHAKVERYEYAAECYEKVIAANPKNTNALFYLASAYANSFQADKAVDCYRRILDADPTHILSLCNLAFNRSYMHPYDAEAIARETMHYAKLCAEANPSDLPPAVAREPEKKLHIGLLTPTLNAIHPVGHFLKGLLLSDAAKQFDWSAYLPREKDDELTREVKPLFKHWHNILAWSDKKAAEQIRSDGIDVLIDLAGFADGNRAGIFFGQTAPVQLEWLDWFATTGLPHMNGVLADPYCVPSEDEHLFSEKVWRLPHTRLCMQPPQFDIAVAPLPANERGYVTFGCYQNPRKLSDEVLQTWGEIAKACPDAHWFFKGKYVPGSQSQQHFQQKLEEFGFNPANLHFEGPSSRQEYLQSYNGIDLILDTFPYPGGTTTVEALWMGVPTMTLTQPGMIARQGEQLLSAAGYPEFVCRSRDEFIEKGIYWAAPENREKLTALRAAIRDKVLASPVFDTEQFAQDWCDLIREIWRDACEKAEKGGAQ